MHKQELQAFMNSDEALNIQQLTLLWSCKEAVFKWWGNGEVDFSEMIRIKHFELLQKGNATIEFKENELQLAYELLGKLCVAWVVQ